MEWDRITLALNLLAVDPAGLKGLWLRARASGLRDRVTAALSAVALPAERLHPGITDDALYGGLDLSATLASGRPVMSRGLLARPALLVLTMAERVPPGLAARLAQALDGAGPCLVALDEAAEEGEGLPPCLTDRLALFVDLDGIAFSDTGEILPDTARITAARAGLPALTTPPGAIAALTRAAAELGIASLRAPLLALAAARAHAAFCGRPEVTAEDLTLAAELVFGHRALPMTEDAPPDAADPPPPPPPDSPDDRAKDQDRPDDSTAFPEEVLIAAARAALPADMLEKLAADRAARQARGASGTGAERGGNRRGRPLPSRPGRLGTGARIDLVATLRAAAPWQPLRRRQSARADAVLLVRPADIRLKRFREMSDRVLVFAVDASGSSAFARLAEAKGAIELLLARAYARRDHVALIAFRGRAAELILPPTRSLVQTKRRLQGLPGGGGTPLAAGLQMAMATAQQARARGLTPTLAVLTDGRGNIALSGAADREQAETDALAVARAIRGLGLSGVIIDTANRPQPSLATLAQGMGVPCLALPRADAHRLSAALGAVVGD